MTHIGINTINAHGQITAIRDVSGSTMADAMKRALDCISEQVVNDGETAFDLTVIVS